MSLGTKTLVDEPFGQRGERHTLTTRLFTQTIVHRFVSEADGHHTHDHSVVTCSRFRSGRGIDGRRREASDIPSGLSTPGRSASWVERGATARGHGG